VRLSSTLGAREGQYGIGARREVGVGEPGQDQDPVALGVLALAEVQEIQEPVERALAGGGGLGQCKETFGPDEAYRDLLAFYDPPAL
jgi:hypothetical protein